MAKHDLLKNVTVKGPTAFLWVVHDCIKLAFRIKFHLSDVVTLIYQATIL